MGEGKLKLGEACHACGHFRGLHTPLGGCIALGNCRCTQTQISILERALSIALMLLDALGVDPTDA